MKPYPSTQHTATSVKNTPNNPLNFDLSTGWGDPRKTTWSQVSKLGSPLLLCWLMQACAGNELDSTALGAKEGQGPPPSAAYVQEMPYDPQHDDPSHDSFLRLRGGMLGSEETKARTNPPPDTPLGAPAPSTTPPAETKAAFTLSPTQAYWQKLPAPQRAKLRTTTGLVEAFNQAQAPEARTALREWLHAYVTWYDNQPLGIQKERVEEYMSLVKLVPHKDDPKDQELLQRYLASFINKLSMQELHASEENAIEALATSLPLLSPHTFQGSKTLVELSQMLTQKLVRLERNHLTEGNFPAYRHTLEALHQTVMHPKI